MLFAGMAVSAYLLARVGDPAEGRRARASLAEPVAERI